MPDKKVEHKYCSRCEKDMTNHDGTTVMGASISCAIADSNDNLVSFAKKQFGKYDIKK